LAATYWASKPIESGGQYYEMEIKIFDGVILSSQAQMTGELHSLWWEEFGLWGNEYPYFGPAILKYSDQNRVVYRYKSPRDYSQCGSVIKNIQYECGAWYSDLDARIEITTSVDTDYSVK